MFRKIVKLTLMGIAWGCTCLCVISAIGIYFMGYEWFMDAPRTYSAQVLAAMLIGVGFSVPSIIYDTEKFSRIQQFVIHFGAGFLIYLPTAFYMKWIPIENIRIMTASIAVMAVGSWLVWFCFYLYYKIEAKAINQQIAKQGKEEGYNIK